MESTDYYRPSMDMYGSEQPPAYYHYPTGMPSGNGREAAAYGRSTAAPSADPSAAFYGASNWYTRDGKPWDTPVSNSGYDPWMMPSPWMYDWANNQQQLPDGSMVSYHQQMPGFYTQSESLPLPVAQKSDGGYITPEYSVDYQEMAGATPIDSSEAMQMGFTHTVKTEPSTVCKPELDTVEYAAPTPPVSPYECLQFDHCALLQPQTNAPSAQSEASVLFEVKILPEPTQSVDVDIDQEAQQQQPDTAQKQLIKPPKNPRVKQPRKSQLQTQWSCEECNKCFIRRLGLIQHNAIKHAGDRPFGCSKCGKRFADAKLLDKHAHRHQSMDKPFKCVHCTKQFYYRMDLIRHGYKHTGNSPHVCTYCSKTFSRQDHLRRHEFIHERENAGNM